MNPLALVGGGLVFAVFLFGRKRKRSRKKKGRGPDTLINLPPPPTPCEFAPGVWGYRDAQGVCVEVWNPAIEAQVLAALQQEIVNRGLQGDAALCTPVKRYDPHTEAEIFGYPPITEAVVSGAAAAVFGGVWPPPPTAKEWVDVVWQLAWALFARDICGLPPVSSG